MHLKLQLLQIARVSRTAYELNIAKHCKFLNKSVLHVNDSKAATRILKLNLGSLRIILYGDADFANKTDIGPQLGRTELIMSESYKAKQSVHKSHKSRRVVCSVLSARVKLFQICMIQYLFLESSFNSCFEALNHFGS